MWSQKKNLSSTIVGVQLSNLGAGAVNEIVFYKDMQIKSVLFAFNQTGAIECNIKFDNLKSTINNPFVQSATIGYDIDQLTYYFYNNGVNQLIFEEPKRCSIIKITNVSALSGVQFLKVMFEVLI